MICKCRMTPNVVETQAANPLGIALCLCTGRNVKFEWQDGIHWREVLKIERKLKRININRHYYQRLEEQCRNGWANMSIFLSKS